MTKESNRSGVYSYRLEPRTLETENYKITAYYSEISYSKYGESDEIRQEISKEDDYLLKESQCEE